MFNAGTIVKVLVANIPNAGYDYRLTEPADIGTFVRVNVMNRPCVGIIWGYGDSNLPTEKIKNVSVRTTFIVGYPGETEEEFNDLCDFIKVAKFDKAGVFAYSREKNTYAYNLKPQINAKIKNASRPGFNVHVNAKIKNSSRTSFNVHVNALVRNP